jgi:hypothetical protein|tara:strand:- start:213 stop:347 length:135 start_codon:yes stop_codon:yes gene_type:complete
MDPTLVDKEIRRAQKLFIEIKVLNFTYYLLRISLANDTNNYWRG